MNDLFIFVLILISSIPLDTVLKIPHINSNQLFSLFLFCLFLFGIFRSSKDKLIFASMKLLPFLFLFILSLFSLPLVLKGLTDFKEIYRIAFLLTFLYFLSTKPFRKKDVDKIEKVISLTGVVVLLIYGMVYISSYMYKTKLLNPLEIGGVKFYRFKGLYAGDYVVTSMLFFVNFYLLEFLVKRKKSGILFSFIALFLLGTTKSRWGFICLIFSFLVIGLYCLLRKKGQIFRFLFLILALFVFLLVFGHAYMARFSIHAFKNLNLFSSNRLPSYKFAIENFFKDVSSLTFIFGKGSNRINILLKEASLHMLHNDYLMIFFNYGIIGLLLWLWFMASLVYISLRAVKKYIQCDTFVLFSILSFSMVAIIAISGLFTFILQSYMRVICLFIPIGIVLSFSEGISASSLLSKLTSFLDKLHYPRFLRIPVDDTNGFRRVLDIGCGMDKTKGAIGLDKIFPSSADVIGDICKLPFRDNCIDLVIAKSVLEHISDLITAFNEVYRVLKINGVFRGKVPHAFGRDAIENPTHKSFFTINTILFFTGNAPQYYKIVNFKLNYCKLRIKINFPAYGPIMKKIVELILLPINIPLILLGFCIPKLCEELVKLPFFVGEIYFELVKGR